mmetsp:Transcript_49480/g.158323  ORF Transcript_49480/g.158323 Transcript_49480/m.158323 type:complete len:204 (-) Transcript_49480:256-867(-)
MSQSTSASPAGPATSRMCTALAPGSSSCTARHAAPGSHHRAACAWRSSATRGGRLTKLSVSPHSSGSPRASRLARSCGFPAPPACGPESCTRQRPIVFPAAQRAAQSKSGGHCSSEGKGGSSGTSTFEKVSPMSRLSQRSRCTSEEMPPATSRARGLPGTVAQATSARGPKGALSHMRCHVRQSVSEAQTSARRPAIAWPPTT